MSYVETDHTHQLEGVAVGNHTVPQRVVERHLAIFDVILQRERLGSTGVGNGIAIPHGKLNNLPSIIGIFARLETPVDFEALDDQPVDLVFLLLAPEGAGADHLKALSRIARVLRDQDMVAKIRSSDSASAIYTLLDDDATSHAA